MQHYGKRVTFNVKAVEEWHQYGLRDDFIDFFAAIQLAS